jgi:hypothetical protein
VSKYNPEYYQRTKEKARAYYLANRDRIIAKNKVYRETRKEKAREYSRRSMAKSRLARKLPVPVEPLEVERLGRQLTLAFERAARHGQGDVVVRLREIMREASAYAP